MRTSLQRAGRRRLRAALAITVASLTWVSMAVTPARAVDTSDTQLDALQVKVSGTNQLKETFSPSKLAYTLKISVPFAEKNAVLFVATDSDIESAYEWQLDGTPSYSAFTSADPTSVTGLKAGTNVLNLRVTQNSPFLQTVYKVTIEVEAGDSDTTLAAFGCQSGCSVTPTFSAGAANGSLPYPVYSSSWIGNGTTTVTVGISFRNTTQTLKVWRWADSDTPPTDANWSGRSPLPNSTTSVVLGASQTTAGNDSAFSKGHIPSIYSFQVTSESGAKGIYILKIFRRDTETSAYLFNGTSGLRLYVGDTAQTLTQSDGVTTGFARDKKNYTATVSAGTTEVGLRPIEGVAGQLIEYQKSGTSTWTALTSGSRSDISISGSPITIKVRVRSPYGPDSGGDYTENTDGTGAYQMTYQVTITGASAPTGALKNLVCTTCALSPDFAQTTKTYTSTVAAGVTSVNFTPTAPDGWAGGTIACKVNSTTVSPACSLGSAFTANLNAGNNTVEITVTPTGGTASTYTVTVTRGAAVASLATLSVTPTTGGCTLSPAFVPNSNTVKEFSCTVPNGATSVTVAATPTSTETIGYRVGGSGDFGTTATLSLGVIGANVVEVKATLGTGNSAPTTTYKITVTRQGEGKLSGITLTVGGKPVTLTPTFSKDVLNYSVTVAAASVLLAVTKVEASATLGLTVREAAVSGFTGTSTTVTLVKGANAVKITVTPAGGGTPVVYTLTINAKRCVVPNVVGKSFAVAKNALRTAGCGWTVTKVSSTKAKGTVVSQTPAFNSLKPKQNRKGLGFKVALTVSKGSGASRMALSARETRLRLAGRIEGDLRRGGV